MSQPTLDQALLDSGIVIRYLRGWAKAADLLSALSATHTLCLSAATVAEILVGCRTETEFQAVTQTLDAFEILAIDGEVARLDATLMRQQPGLFGRQVARGFADALIVATAWRYDAMLYTLNSRQFAHLAIPQLRMRIITQDALTWI